jgi:hypothetical protein
LVELGGTGSVAPGGTEAASAPGGQRALRTGGRGVGRLVRAALAALLALSLLGGAGLAGLSWRLAQGPLDVGWLAHRIEAAHNAPDAPSRLRIGGASVKWQGFSGGAGRALDLQLRDVQLAGAGGTAAEVAVADLALSPAGLLTGRVLPRDVQLDGLRLRLLRTADGRVGLDLGSPALAARDAANLDGPVPDVADAVAELARPARSDQGGGATAREIAQLRSVQVRNAAVTMVDRRLGATLDVSGVMLDLRRQPGGGVVGDGTAALALGGAGSQLTLRAELAEDGTRIAASLTPVSLSALAAALPTLALPVQVDAALQLSAAATLSAALQPRSLAVHAAAGGGHARLPEAELAFEGLALDAEGDWDAASWGLPDRVALSRLQVVVASPAGGWDTTLGVTGQAVRRADRLRADLALTVDHLAFADLPKLWPAAWGGHARPWIVQNITAGTARDGQVTLGLEAPPDLSRVKLVAAGGTLQGDDVTIHWLRPVPPIEHAQALLTIPGPDTLEIAVPSARQGAGQLSNGVVRITGLSVKDQLLSVNADVAAPVPDLLTLLRHPRLHLLDRHPLPVRNPAGSLAGKLSVNLPLEEHLEFSDVTIHAQGQLSGLRLGGLVAGRDLDHGDIAIDVTADALKASGRAAVGGIPAALSVDMDFRPGPPSQVVQRATASGTATAPQLASAGLDAGGLIGAGALGFNAAYQTQRDGQGEVWVQADLRDVALAAVGWAKPAGQPASASARLLLKADRLQGIGDLQAQGPGLQVRGRADMVGDKPALLVLDPITLGPTQAHGEIRFPDAPGQPIRAKLSGTALDLSSALAAKPGQGDAPKGSADGTPWTADAAFDKVLLAEGRTLAAVTAHAEHDGRRLRVLQAQSGGPERLQATVKPQGNGRAVSVRAADGGALLRALGVLQTVDGGQLAVDARFDDRTPVSVLSGTADLRQFSVRDAPAVGKLLQALTIYGIGEAMSGPGLAFTRLNAPFRWDGEVLELTEAQAFSASLGLTAHGRIDATRKTLDIQGTIVPAYALNSALGRIPLLGRLFSAEQGGGLFAVNYAVRGPLADPAVSVNPLSALTPGFLRGLFRMFN